MKKSEEDGKELLLQEDRKSLQFYKKLGKFNLILGSVSIATFLVASALNPSLVMSLSGLSIIFANVVNAMIYFYSKNESRFLNKEIFQLEREFHQNTKEKKTTNPKIAGKKKSSSAVNTAQLKSTVSLENHGEEITNDDIDSIFDENGYLRNLDALGDISSDTPGYPNDNPKVLKR